MPIKKRQSFSSQSPLEKTIGFSRAVRVGNYIAIAGTAPIGSHGVTACVGDVYGQTKCCLEIIQKAIEGVGAKISDVVRTRLMLTNITLWESAAKAHGEFFSDIAPACTFVEVSRFIKSDWLIEIEADCLIADETL